MGRKNKTLRAFLHQNESPTIEQAWDHAWKGAQKEFHARSMQEMEAKIDRLVEALTWCRSQEQWRYMPYDGAHDIEDLLTELQAGKGGE